MPVRIVDIHLAHAVGPVLWALDLDTAALKMVVPCIEIGNLYREVMIAMGSDEWRIALYQVKALARSEREPGSREGERGAFDGV